jgi:hypothetical protein
LHRDQKDKKIRQKNLNLKKAIKKILFKKKNSIKTSKKILKSIQKKFLKFQNPNVPKYSASKFLQ